MKKLIALAAALLGLALTGCAAPTGVTTEGVTPPPASAGQTTDDGGGDDAVTKVGEWARADDGVEFRVAKLKRGTVSDIAAGGHPGDAAVVVTVEVRNGGDKRFDLSMVDVKVRLGTDGDEAEQVFQDGFDGGFDGTLAPGRRASTKYMFAARKAADLKAVSVEIAPGLEYGSATFEGGL